MEWKVPGGNPVSAGFIYPALLRPRQCPDHTVTRSALSFRCSRPCGFATPPHKDSELSRHERITLGELTYSRHADVLGECLKGCALYLWLVATTLSRVMHRKLYVLNLPARQGLGRVTCRVPNDQTLRIHCFMLLG